VSTIWQLVAEESESRRPLVVASVVKDSGSVPRRAGAKMLVYADGRTRGTVGGGVFEQLVIRDALAALREGASRTKAYSFNPRGSGTDAFGAVCGGRAEIFLEVVMPLDRLLIVGGGHCGRALARAASPLDFGIVVADDREEFSRPDDFAFPGVEQVLHSRSDYADLPDPDTQTYVALVTKGFLTDEAALRRVIDSPAAYIGMMGSIKKRETVFAKLRADGVPEQSLARVHSPIGLEIGAETPAEIAVSILAEIVQVRAQIRTAAAASSATAAATASVHSNSTPTPNSNPTATSASPGAASDNATAVTPVPVESAAD
jgi:xanthine dehydrogenase accessory factor